MQETAWVGQYLMMHTFSTYVICDHLLVVIFCGDSHFSALISDKKEWLPSICVMMMLVIVILVDKEKLLKTKPLQQNNLL